MNKRGNPFPNSIVPVIRKAKAPKINWNPKPYPPEKPDWWRASFTGLRLGTPYAEDSLWQAWEKACDLTCEGK